MWEKGGAEWGGWCQEGASASLSVPLSALNEKGKTKRPSPFMVISNGRYRQTGG